MTRKDCLITYIYIIVLVIAPMCGTFCSKCHQIITISLAFKCLTIPLLLHDAIIFIEISRNLVAITQVTHRLRCYGLSAQDQLLLLKVL